MSSRRRKILAMVLVAAVGAGVAVVAYTRFATTNGNTTKPPTHGKFFVIVGGDAGRSARFHVKDGRLFFPAGARRPSLELSEYQFAHWSDGHRYAVVYKYGDTRGTLYDQNGSEVARVTTSKPRYAITVSDQGYQLYSGLQVMGEQPWSDVELHSESGRLLFETGRFHPDNVRALFLSEHGVLVTHTTSRGVAPSVSYDGEAVLFNSEGREVWKRKCLHLQIDRTVVSETGGYFGFLLSTCDYMLHSNQFLSREGEPVWSHSFRESLEGRGRVACISAPPSPDGPRVAG